MTIDWPLLIAAAANLFAIAAAYHAVKSQTGSNAKAVERMERQLEELTRKIGNGINDRLVRVETKLDTVNSWVKDLDSQFERFTGKRGTQ